MMGSAEDQKRELLRHLLQERMAKERYQKSPKILVAPAAAEPNTCLMPVPRDRDLELSFGQEMVWLLEQIIPEIMFYNIVERFRIKGPLDIDLLRRCIDEVIKRHEVLRTIYPLVAGRPVQRINPPAPCDLRVLDLRSIAAPRREQEARRVIVADVKTRFDIAIGPVIRPSLLQVGDEEFILAIVIHHIAIDGWSLRLFINEIVAFYGAYGKGDTPVLPPLPVQYADFACWQRRRLAGDVLARHRDYWREKLGDHPPILNLRSDFSPGSIRTFESSVFQVTVNSETLEALKEIGRRAGATLFTVLLAAFATLLMRFSGQEDFIIGSVMSGRVRPEVENLLGFFVNSLALRVDLSGNPTFSELVRRAREIVFAAHEHGEYPFQQLVEVMRPKRSANSNPFVQVFLNMHNLWDRDEVPLPNLSIRPLGGIDLHMPAEFFTVIASGSARRMDLSFVYSTELFKAETIERVATDLHGLLEAAAAAPNSRIWDLPMSAKQIEAPTDGIGDLLAQLGALGGRISVEDGRLKVNAPKGALNDHLKAGIASQRENIIARLHADAPRGPEARKLQSVARSAPLPLTAVQKRFWFLDKIGHGRSVPNVMFPLRFEGPIDFDAMMTAVTAVLARHETLLMRIGDRDGEPYPEISAVPGELVTIADLTALPDESRELEGDKLSKQFTQDEFNLATGPLAKVLFVRLSPTATLLTLSMHHIVADGWSSSILLRELGAVYSALSNGRAPDLPPLAHQYVDYAAWEAAQVRDGLFERQVGYWREKLASAPPLLDLPTDRPRPARRSFQGSRVDCVIAADVVARLQRFSKRHDATLFMTVLAGFAVVLHRLTAQEDIVIGTPAANRSNPDLEQIVGPFVNSISLRLNTAGNPSFASYLSQVRRATIEAIDNRDVPFDMVVEAINPARTLDHAPIYQVMFGLHNFPVQPPRFEGLECSYVSPDTRVARLDLQLDMAVHEGQLFGAYEYASDLFDHVTIERVHEQLVEVLNSVLDDEGKSVRDLPMRSLAHDRILLDVWNDSRVDHERGACLHQLFERAAARNPESVAFIIGAETYSYRDIDRRANQLARLLARRGVRPGDRVGLCLDRTVETPVAMAAVLKAGAAYVPLDPAHPPDRLRYIVEDARIACLVTMSWLAELFDPADVPTVFLDAAESELERLEPSAPMVPVAPDDVAYVIYTSGSTGRPKGVQVEHRNVVSFLDAMRREPGLESSDVLLAVTTLSFDIAGLEIWLPLSVGAKVVLASKADVLIGAKLIELIERHRVTAMQGDAFDLASPARSRMERQVRPEGAVWRRSHAGRPRRGAAPQSSATLEHVRTDGNDDLVHHEPGRGRGGRAADRQADREYARLCSRALGRAGSARRLRRTGHRRRGSLARILEPPEAHDRKIREYVLARRADRAVVPDRRYRPIP